MESRNTGRPGRGGPGRLPEYLARQGHRFVVLALELLLAHDFVYRILGALGSRRPLIDCVFLSYPGDRRAARAIFPPPLIERHRWRPGLIGLYRQAGRWGLRFAVAACEEELCDEANDSRLRTLVEEVERIQGLLRAPRRAFAGVVPGVLYGRGHSRETGEAETAAHCVERAIHELRRRERLPVDSAIVLLGARGFVGRRLVERLSDEPIVCLDLVAGRSPELPAELRDAPTLLVNLTRPAVLESYADQLWPGLVILNEVYPPPSPAAIARMHERGARIHHLSGVLGRAFPRFRGAYAGSIPCCAARQIDDMELRLIRLDTP